MVVNIFPQDSGEPPIYFTMLSKFHDQETVNRPRGLQDHSLLLFVIEGEGKFYCDGKTLDLKKGSAFYLDSETPHGYEDCGNLKTAWIGYRGRGCEGIRSFFENRPYVFIDKVDLSKYVARIEEMEREYFAERRQGILSASLYYVLFSFFEESRKPSSDEMDTVLKYLEEHFNEKITIKSLAELIFCSKSTLCYKFKQKFGCTVFEKLINIRLLNAELLLKMNAKEKVSVIAKKCGFDDVGYFCKLYKKKIGITPSESR